MFLNSLYSIRVFFTMRKKKRFGMAKTVNIMRTNRDFCRIHFCQFEEAVTLTLLREARLTLLLLLLLLLFPSKETTHNNPIWPEIWILDFIHFSFLYSKTEALEVMMLPDHIKLNHLNTEFRYCLFCFLSRNVHRDVSNIEFSGKICSSPRNKSFDDFLTNNQI